LLPLLTAAAVTGILGAVVRPLLIEVAAAIGWLAAGFGRFWSG
jgi:hypothetical protein